MLSKITSTTEKVKNHVVRNRAKYATAATAVVCLKVHRSVVDGFNTFLEEKDLLNEYYAITE